MPVLKFLSLVFLVATLPGAEIHREATSDRDVLLAGVNEINAPGSPGGICVFGPQAMALIGGKVGSKALGAVVASARWEKGRIVAFGHDGYLSSFSENDTGRLLLNSVRWSAGPSDPAQKLRVAVKGSEALQKYLTQNGVDAQPAGGEQDWAQKLTGSRVLCIDARTLKPADIAPISQFVRNGGGLVTAATGWGWSSLNAGRNLATDFVGNQLLAPSGLVWSGAMPGRTSEHGFSAGATDLTYLNASTALGSLSPQANPASNLPREQLIQASKSLSDALQAAPPGDALLLPKIAALEKAANSHEYPRPDQPLRAENAIGRLMFTRTLETLLHAPPEQLRSHPAAEFFPGNVPADAPRLSSRTVTVDTMVPNWHSTGLYAAPGELIHVQLAAETANKGLSVRIGCHKDLLWDADVWKRAPEVCRVEKIAEPLTTAANPFGGPVYIEVPENCKLGTLTVTISGAVQAPHFIRGKTTLDQWRTQLRQAPAPWAELETSKVILSMPAKEIRMLEDPEALLTLWDRILDAEADLATIPHERKRPERIVADVQISAGYMHSGYPIMTPLDSVANAVQLEKLKAGSWGHFHELGHNHQQPEWTFGGTTEVTCNLFSLYVCETICGLPPGTGHPAMTPAEVAKRLSSYMARPNFERWKADPFTALMMYDELRQGFGWDTYKKVFAEYRAQPKEQRPKTEEEKRDQWMVRFSRAAGKNLGPFFVAWGVPTSDKARASVAELPAWMPENWPK